jgi:OFA family oxalate/formate antiporter-like MFS transporter
VAFGDTSMSVYADAIPSTFASELRDKWPVVLVGYFMMLFAFGVPTFALPFIYTGAIDEFDWTRQQAVMLASIKFGVAAVASLLIGRLLDQHDPKYIISACAAFGGLGLLSFYFVDSLWVYYSIGIVLGCNSAGMAVGMNTLVARTFERSTGTMLGIVLAGTSTAGLIVPIMMVPLMDSYGWRGTMMLMSLGIWLAALPAWLYLLRDGNALGQQVRSARQAARNSGMWEHFKVVARTRAFWAIIIGIFFVSAVDQGLLQNQVLFLNNEKGLDLGQVAWATSLLAAIGIGSKILFGWIFDRWSIAGIAFCYAMLAVSVGLAFAVAGVVTMVLFMVVRGFAHGGLIVDGPVLAKHYYGPTNVGLNIGLFSLCTSLGFSVGPSVLAGMADASGSYLGGFGLAVAASVLAAAFLYPIKPRFWSTT